MRQSIIFCSGNGVYFLYGQLNDYIHIDSGGKLKNNVVEPILDKLEFQ